MKGLNSEEYYLRKIEESEKNTAQLEQKLHNLEKAQQIIQRGEKIFSEEDVRFFVTQGIRETNKHIIENGTMKGVDAKHFAQKWIENKLKESQHDAVER